MGFYFSKGIDPGAIKTDLISVDSNQKLILGIKLQKSCEHVRAHTGRIIYPGGPHAARRP